MLVSGLRRLCKLSRCRLGAVAATPAVAGLLIAGMVAPLVDVSRQPRPAVADEYDAVAGYLGEGSLPVDAFWAARHHGMPLPAALNGASRYQIYLFEQGRPFARKGRRTVYPLGAALPEDFQVIVPHRRGF